MNLLCVIARWVVNLCIYPLRLFHFTGVPVKWHVSWLLHPGGYFVWLAVSGKLGPQNTAIFVASFLFSMLAHEFAHVWAARAFGCRTDSVVILPFGCVALLRKEPEGAEEFWVALAGPAMSLLLTLLAAVALAWGDEPVRHAARHHPMIWTFGFLNLVMALFNLLPMHPMDGGRMLRSALSCGLRRARPGLGGRAHLIATRIAVRCVGLPVALGLMVFTVCVTHYWHHLLLLALVIWMGELEFEFARENCLSQAGVKYLKLPLQHGPLWRDRRRPVAPHRNAAAESQSPSASYPIARHAPA